jgi:cytochrome bd ubiquinol oxidase subunit I
MVKLVAKGPGESEDEHAPHDPGQSQRPARPLSAAPDHIDPAVN